MSTDITSLANSSVEKHTTRCCIVGGGPAGVALGFLLARAGLDTLILEKHGDFLRDFRGDTIHPSTLELMYELGLLDEFLRRPHQEYRNISLNFNGAEVNVADLSHLPTHCKFVALMPQWDFLNFLTEQGSRYPTFRVRMQNEVTDLLIEDGRVTGVAGKIPTGRFEVRADLTVGADGRHSIVRNKGNLQVDDLGAPIDVLWMRISRRPSDPEFTFGHVRPGRMLVTINRGDYWQCARVIPKGAFDEIRRRGLPAFRDDLGDIAPFLRDRTSELQDWNDIKVLTVLVDRLREWSRPGLLCIGDSAHAMSPVGGVGINLAIQDAVAAANILCEPLLRGVVDMRELRAVQHRREFPTRVTQALQVQAHMRVLKPVLENRADFSKLPLPLRLFRSLPVLRRLPARVIGIGVRPEHVRTAARGGAAFPTPAAAQHRSLEH
jgi:2-polyprenyl-6-methoxyphenol hydroxylase-like FAD-dependent oxidoreductase